MPRCPSIIAEARYVRTGDGASAEFGIAVTDAWQRRGIGSALLGMIEQAAAAAGVTRLTGESLAVNDTFLSFARSCGFAVRRDSVDYSILRVEKQIGASPRPDPGWC
jgi:acetyltransferase